MALKTDYKDYQFQEGESLRKYQEISNDDGTISFRDVTNYQQVGNRFSASDINATNTKVNEVDQTATDLKTDVNDLQSQIADLIQPNSGSHNSIYRGKFLGNSVTEAQYQALRDGTFTDLFIGDYWTIGGVNYRIAAFDYFLNCGDTSTTRHHAVIVPDTALYDHAMNGTDTTEGGYAGSKMHTEGLEQAKTTIKEAFSGHVLKHRVYLTNAVSNGFASASAWVDSEVDLMNENMVYGSAIFRPQNSLGATIPSSHMVEYSQLPLFAHDKPKICNRETYWLIDIVTAAYFTFVDYSGFVAYGAASASLGVRPYFCIYGGN